MATQEEIGAAYNYLDELFRISIGEYGDFTGAMYNGDFSLSLETAQKQKHDFILDSLNVQSGQRVLDIGSGWGPMLNAIRNKGAKGLGITLSVAQAESCKRNGLEARIQDWKTLNKEEYGTFDAVVSVGAFEHFCSREEWEAGKQDAIYQDFFKLCADLLPKGGRLFVQTQYYGRTRVDPEKVSVKAPRNSNEWLFALVEKFYPGSWLPYGEEQIIKAAQPHFKVVSLNNGRRDYLQTIKEWRSRLWAFNFMKYLKMVGLVKYFFTDKDFRFRMKMINVAAHKKCLEREIFDHQRMVFEKL